MIHMKGERYYYHLLYFKAMLKKRNMENKTTTKGPQFGLFYSAKNTFISNKIPLSCVLTMSSLIYTFDINIIKSSIMLLIFVNQQTILANRLFI